MRAMTMLGRAEEKVIINWLPHTYVRILQCFSTMT